ncbi:hypothetical protein [Neobacillus sp. D3-1R]|uniref:hypothetical protein n=1 Tax=Neobacillus sp. D3-1R TaxID=3445778 RepID=UPI003F9FC05E
MALPLSIILVVVISYIAFFMKKSMSFLQNSILFMLMEISTRNYISIMSLVLKKIKTTDNEVLFIFLLIHREIIIPLLVLIFCNLYLLSDGWVKKVSAFILILSTLQVMDVLSVYFKVEKFLRWNMISDLFINIAYLLIGLLISKLLLLLSKREGTKHERSL